MVRPRPVVVLVLAVLAGLSQNPAHAEKDAAHASAPPSASASASAPVESIDRLAYKIAVSLEFDPETRIDARGQGFVLDAWQSMVDRFVGAPWKLSLIDEKSFRSRLDLDTMEPASFQELEGEFDKVWVIRVRREGPALVPIGREFDAATRRLGPTCRHLAKITPDLPRALLELARELFRPSAVVGEQSGGGVALTVRGASLRASGPIGQVVEAGTVFRPIRIVTLPGGEKRILDIPFTYLRVESLDGAVTRCAIDSALRDPLTRRYAQKNELLALGSKPGPHPTRLRFVTTPDKQPAAGYRLTARTLPDGQAREVGTTDREGRIVLEPGRSEGLLALRLLGGSAEPLVEFPLMPGESDRERVLPPFDPKALTITLETQLDSLRDRVLDLVAIRARLETRLKARFEGEDWDGAEATLKEYARLPSRETFAAQLARLKEDAAQLQVRNKTAVLTKSAQAQVAEVDGLIARYLDDEVFRAYADALTKARSDATDRAKAAAKGKKK